MTISFASSLPKHTNSTQNDSHAPNTPIGDSNRDGQVSMKPATNKLTIFWGTTFFVAPVKIVETLLTDK